MRGEYLLVLLGSFAAVAILDRVARLGVLRQGRRLLIALAPVTTVVLAWDLAGVGRWGWSSNRATLLGPSWLGIPLEEYLFPAVIGVCALVLWELVKLRADERPRPSGAVWEEARARRAGLPALVPLRWEYLSSGVAAVAAVALLDWALGTRLLARRAYQAYLGIMLGFQVLFETYATLRPVYLWDDCCVAARLLRIPVEDFLFGLVLYGLATVMWEWSGRPKRRGGGRTHADGGIR